jgi:hypothetical protein
MLGSRGALKAHTGEPVGEAADTTARLCDLLRGHASSVPRGPEGAALIELALLHRVHLVLAWRLGLGPSALATIAEDWSAWLAEEMRTHALADALRTRELARVVTALDSAGLAPIVFKGAALAHTHYAASWLRPRIDTDVLVAPGSQDAAVRVLAALGYTTPPFVEGEFVMYQRPLVRSGTYPGGYPGGLAGDDVIDLHWRIANREAVAHVLSYDDIAGRAHAVPVLGQPMRVPAPDHALVLACLHRAAHHQDADDLLWLLDIHLLAERLTDDEWSRVVAVATSGAVTAVCSRGLFLAAERFRTAVPAVVREALAPDPGRRRDEPSALYLRRDLRRTQVLLSDARALGPKAGARLVWEVLFPSAPYMAAAFGAGHGLRLWSAYARRIAGGAGKWMRRSGARGVDT